MLAIGQNDQDACKALNHFCCNLWITPCHSRPSNTLLHVKYSATATGEYIMASNTIFRKIPRYVWCVVTTISSHAYHAWDKGPINVKPVIPTCMVRSQSCWNLSSQWSEWTRGNCSSLWLKVSDRDMMRLAVTAFVFKGCLASMLPYNFHIVT